MKKNTKLMISVVTLLVLILVTVVGLININPSKECNMNTTCVVENQKMVSAIPDSVIEIDKDGEYVFHLAWDFDSEPGFVTQCMVLDENDNMLFDITGDVVDARTVPMKLNKGAYRISFDYFNTEGEWEEYSRNLSPEDISGGVFKSYSDGSWNAHIKIEINGHNTALRNVFMFLMLTLITLDLVALMLISSKNSDKTKSEYDERQMTARGEAYKYSFFVLLISSALIGFVQMNNIELPVVSTTLLFWAISLSILVFCTISIWKDAYFALNENRTTLIIIFAIICIVNLVMLISTIVSGSFIIDGRIDYGGISCASCVMFVWIFAMLLAKSIKDKKEDD